MKKLVHHHATSAPRLAPSREAEVLGYSLRASVEGYFERYGRPNRGSHILAAVSGGPDSVAMLIVLLDLSNDCDWKIGVAHVDHGLRGDESTADCAFVQQLANSFGVQFHSLRLDPTVAHSERNVQAWARAERYKFLESTAKRNNYSHIAVAHQLDDRAETVAAAVMDAAGTFALSGIPPVRGTIIRPLFDSSRELIVSYLAARGLGYRVDASNESTKYQRNRIRHTVLPLWKAENPGIIEGLARLGEQVWIQRRYLEEKASGIISRALCSTDSSGLTLRIAPLSRYDIALDPYILRELVLRLGLDILPRENLVSRFFELRKKRDRDGSCSIEQGEFAIHLSQGLIKVYRKRARTRAIQTAAGAQPAPQLETRVVNLGRPVKSDDKELARFDLDSVEGELSVRWPLPGDRYQPIGMRGTKKLSDLLADRKVPSFERPLVPVVVDNLGILWPIGHPIAHRARLTDRTRRVMEARLQEGTWKNRS